jgi:hypothetical protein
MRIISSYFNSLLPDTDIIGGFLGALPRVDEEGI